MYKPKTSQGKLKIFNVNKQGGGVNNMLNNSA